MGDYRCVAVCIVFGGPVAGLLSTGDDFADPGSESEVTAERIEDTTGRDASPAVVALVELPGPVEAVPASARLAEVAGLMAADPDVAEVAGFHQTGERSFVSADGRFSYLAAFLAAGADEEDVGERLEDALAGTEGVRLGGSAIAGPAVGEQVSKDLARAELLAFPILFLLSLWVFRGFVAALLPLFVGVLAIFGTFLGLRLVNEATLLSIYALTWRSRSASAWRSTTASSSSRATAKSSRARARAARRSSEPSRQRAARSCSVRSRSQPRCCR